MALTRIGTTAFGLPLCEFSYIGTTQRFTGVRRRTFSGSCPQAVSCNKAGFYSVDYGMLGIEMRRAA